MDNMANNTTTPQREVIQTKLLPKQVCECGSASIVVRKWPFLCEDVDSSTLEDAFVVQCRACGHEASGIMADSMEQAIEFWDIGRQRGKRFWN